ncbi:DUF2188 domain-containing protein [Pararhizobium sp.]|uniref:DUF2188 domain-containing protein n=1 Tax=Pararhizobium sp. TaxID=1977563 RepID=UPI003D10BA94
MSSKGKHVVPSGGKWSIREAGSSRASRTFTTEDEAVEAAKKIARIEGATLYIHGKDGLIRNRRSYANDLLPAKK